MHLRGRVLVRGLRFRYEGGEFELRIPDLQVQPGELVACIGESGIGKSTMLSLVSGILAPHEGTVEVGGVRLDELGEKGRRAFRIREIGFVFQEFELLDHLNVRENILLPFLMCSALVLNDAVEGRMRELAVSAGIEKLLHRHPSELSMGERQRVAICRALVTSPALVIADEPTGNLDPETSKRIVELLSSEVRAGGATLLMVTHDPSILSSVDRVIDLGELAGQGA